MSERTIFRRVRGRVIAMRVKHAALDAGQGFSAAVGAVTGYHIATGQGYKLGAKALQKVALFGAAGGLALGIYNRYIKKK